MRPLIYNEYSQSFNSLHHSICFINLWNDTINVIMITSRSVDTPILKREGIRGARVEAWLRGAIHRNKSSYFATTRTPTFQGTFGFVGLHFLFERTLHFQLYQSINYVSSTKYLDRP